MSQLENPQPTETPQGAVPQPPQAHVPPHPAYSPAQGHEGPSALPHQGGQPPQPYGPGQALPPSATSPSKKHLWLAAGAGFGAGVVVTLLVVVGAAFASAGSTPAFEKAVEACDASDRAGISIGDEGKSITIDTKGEDDASGASYDEASCILTGLGVPDSVVSHLDDTSANDGRQNASWDGVEASWTYHPDNGLKVILKEAKK